MKRPREKLCLSLDLQSPNTLSLSIVAVMCFVLHCIYFLNCYVLMLIYINTNEYGFSRICRTQQSVWRQHPRLREQLGFFAHKGEEAGVFWMALHDFFYYFGTLDVCRVRGSCVEHSLTSPKMGASVWTETRVQLSMRDSSKLRTRQSPAVNMTVRTIGRGGHWCV